MGQWNVKILSLFITLDSLFITLDFTIRDMPETPFSPSKREISLTAMIPVFVKKGLMVFQKLL